MAKLDLKKKYKEFYSGKPSEVVQVNVPAFNYLMIDGKGYPGTSQEYQDAMMTLYPIAYTLKFNMKSKGKDYVVMPLEGLWWADDMSIFLSKDEEQKNNWLWTSMIMQPDFIIQKDVDLAIKMTKEKDKPLPGLPKLRFETLEEGLSAQIMHIGPYSDETPNIKKIHEFIKDQGGEFDGHTQKHHEVYLSDPRRTKPERLKTILRQPFIK